MYVLCTIFYVHFCACLMLLCKVWCTFNGYVFGVFCVLFLVSVHDLCTFIVHATVNILEYICCVCFLYVLVRFVYFFCVFLCMFCVGFKVL